MKNHLLALGLAISILIAPSLAVVNKKAVTYRIKRPHKQAVYVKKQEQQRVFSFVDLPKLSKPAEVIKPTLTGIVVKQVSATVELPADASPEQLETSVVELAKEKPILPTKAPLLKGLFQPPMPKKKVLANGVQSWITSIKRPEADGLAKSIAGFISWKLPATSSTLQLTQPANGRDDNLFTQVLTMELRKAGFAIANDSAQVPETHIVQYLVTAMDEGLLVRIRIDQTEASCWYTYNPAGSLIAASPFTVKEALP